MVLILFTKSLDSRFAYLAVPLPCHLNLGRRDVPARDTKDRHRRVQKCSARKEVYGSTGEVSIKAQCLRALDKQSGKKYTFRVRPADI
jgi:hypothetical protein